MKVDITSLFFNSSIKGQTATPAWRTSLGQSKTKAYRLETKTPGIFDIVTGITYKMQSDISKLDMTGISGDLLACSVFDKVYVNKILVENCQFTLLLLRETSASHNGRMQLCYSPHIVYDGYKNLKTFQLIQKVIGCSDAGCWFVYDISILNQDELHFSAVVVDRDKPAIYTITSQERSKEWKSLIPDYDNLLPILDNLSLQKITYGAPGTGKSNGTNEVVRNYKDTVRTTFHPDSDYSTFVGSYKPTTTEEYIYGLNGTETIQFKDKDGNDLKTSKIEYKFIKQAFLKAYILAWKKMCNARVNTQIQPNSTQKPIILSHTNGNMQWEVTKIDDLKIYLTATEVYDKEKFKEGVEQVWKKCWENNTYQYYLTNQNRPQICVCNWMAELNNPDFEFCWTEFLAELSKGEMELNVDPMGDCKPYFFCIDSDNSIKLTRDVSGKKGTILSKEDKGSTNYQQAVANYLKEQYKSSNPNEAWDRLKDDVKGTTTSSTTLTDPLADIRQFLVIEEINRGNCAQIFGDLFQLLDRKNGFSEYPIEADEDLAKCIKEELERLSFDKNVIDYINQLFVDDEMNPQTFDLDGRPVYALEAILNGKILVLPNNLYIWATMNTSDQSLFPIDSAFKRRWDWEYKPIIKPANKNWEIQVGPGYDWWTFLEEVNKIINELTSSEDKKLGYFFAKAKKVGDKDVVDIDTMVNKVFFYLWNDVFKDYDLGHLQSFPKIKDTSKTDSKERPYSFGDFFDKVKGEINKEAVEEFMKAFMPNTATTAAGTTPQEPTEQTTE